MKAVIMAGGEGSRLRPLTCTVPKPMVRVLGKPIIEYIFDSLISSGVSETAVTLGYLPHIIEKQYTSGYKRLKISFIREDEPLGTAGGVKNAAADFKEPFIVVSGDALCNFDFKKIMAFHKASNAAITVVAKQTKDPREYGIVTVDEKNRVTGFVEKPSWSQAVSNLANTGVYIINPECMSLVPKNKKFDFAADLFPMMLEREMPIYCYHTAEYWCDVGNTNAYIKCQRDFLDKKINEKSDDIDNGIYARSGMPAGDYSVIPPIYIGTDVEIADGAVIGPYAVIDDKCTIGPNAKVRYSVVLENSCLADNTAITGALVCSGAALKSGASMFEGSVAGSGSVIGTDASIKPEVMIWPGKTIAPGASACSDVKYGNLKSVIVSEKGVSEKDGTNLSPEMCARLGSAVANVKKSPKIGVAHDGSTAANAMKLAVMSGILATGGTVWDFGKSFTAELEFLVNRCSLDSGLFISEQNGKEISICTEGGLSPDRAFERALQNSMSKGEFHQSQSGGINEVYDMSAVKDIYLRELFSLAPQGLNGTGAKIQCENEKIKNVLGSCFAELGADEKSDIVFKIDFSGKTLCAETPDGEIDHEKLVTVCCAYEMKNGSDVAVPFEFPEYLDLVAQKYNKKVCRYLSAPADSSDSSARALAVKQVFVRDALFLAVKLLSMMKEYGKNLDELIRELPQINRIKKTFAINFSPSDILTVLDKDSKIINASEGIKVGKENGSLLIVPDRSGEKIKVFAEAETMEAADELCTDIEEIIKSLGE